MLAGNIKFCIANFLTGISFKIHFSLFIFYFFFFIKKVEGSEIVGLKIFRSNSQASMIFITYTLLKCLLKSLPNKTMQLIFYMKTAILLAVSKYGRYHSFRLSR